MHLLNWEHKRSSFLNFVLFFKFQIKNKVQKPKNLRIIYLETEGIRSICMVYVYMHMYVRSICTYIRVVPEFYVCVYMYECI